MWEFLKQLTDPQSIIQYGGLWLLLFVIFAETGLLVGFFLPGDNLILLAGILCKSKPDLLMVNYGVLVILMITAAVLGNVFGYWFGRKAGARLYERKDSLIFKKKHLTATEEYYKKFGGNATSNCFTEVLFDLISKTPLLGFGVTNHFVSIVASFIPDGKRLTSLTGPMVLLITQLFGSTETPVTVPDRAILYISVFKLCITRITVSGALTRVNLYSIGVIKTGTDDGIEVL